MECARELHAQDQPLRTFFHPDAAGVGVHVRTKCSHVGGKWGDLATGTHRVHTARQGAGSVVRDNVRVAGPSRRQALHTALADDANHRRVYYMVLFPLPVELLPSYRRFSLSGVH